MIIPSVYNQTENIKVHNSLIQSMKKNNKIKKVLMRKADHPAFNDRV